MSSKIKRSEILFTKPIFRVHTETHIFFKDFIYSFERERESTKGEEEADTPLSREPHAGLAPRTLKSGPELKADA